MNMLNSEDFKFGFLVEFIIVVGLGLIFGSQYLPFIVFGTSLGLFFNAIID